MAEFTVPTPRLEYAIRRSNGPGGLHYEEGGSAPLRDVHRVAASLKPNGNLLVQVEGLAVRHDGRPGRRKRLSYPLEDHMQPAWLMAVIRDAEARLRLEPDGAP